MEFCPVTIFELYISKRNPETPYLWQKAKKKVHFTDAVWYEKNHVGHDPLARFMKFLCTEAELLENDHGTFSGTVGVCCISFIQNTLFFVFRSCRKLT